VEKKLKNDRLHRAYFVEMRAETGEENNHIISGYAAVYDAPADIYGYYEERIARGAFDGCSFKDVILCINHETEKIPLARSRQNNANSTLQLKVDERGLFIRADLDIERNAEAAALYSAVERGDMGGMSFIFKVADEKWEDVDSDKPKRTITKIKEVYEVTAATFPFYEATNLDARAMSSLERERTTLESVRNLEKSPGGDSGALERAQQEKVKAKYKTRAKLGI